MTLWQSLKHSALATYLQQLVAESLKTKDFSYQRDERGSTNGTNFLSDSKEYVEKKENVY